MILGSVFWSCSWGHWCCLGVRPYLLMNSSNLSQLSLEKGGSCSLLKMKAKVLAWGQRKAKHSGCDSQLFGFLLHSVWILRVADLDEKRKGIGSNNPLFPAGLIFNYQRCSAKNLTRAAHSGNVCNVCCSQAIVLLLIHSWNRKCALNTRKKLS